MQKHTGSCHCGKVTYAVVADITRVMACNCSICRRRGWLLDFVPEGQFTLLSGADNLTEYQFNTRKIHHLFCKDCGVASFGNGTGPDGRQMVAINVRCLDDFDFESLPVTPFNGKVL